VDEEGTLWFNDRLVVPKNHGLRKKIFDEVHASKYSIHLGSTKMYHDLKAQYWWTRMKCETARYVAECDMCRRVKADHMRHAGLSQPEYSCLEMGRHQYGSHRRSASHRPQV
jgi:hypothetical protein